MDWNINLSSDYLDSECLEIVFENLTSSFILSCLIIITPIITSISISIPDRCLVSYVKPFLTIAIT